MFDYIKGACAHKFSSTKGSFVTVETCGIGYELEIMERDFALLPAGEDEVKIYTVLIHREDKMSLCGFIKREDRDIFNILTSVSGVGVKMAMTLLNSFEVSDLVGFVLDGDYKELTRAKGVGQKLAQKIILELKDKLTSFEGGTNANASKIKIESQNMQDARMVLLSLGYNGDEADFALKNALNKIDKNSAAEEILKESLRLLSIG